MEKCVLAAIQTAHDGRRRCVGAGHLGGGRDGGAHDVADDGPCSYDRLYGASRQAGGRCSADATVGAHAGWPGRVPRLS